MRSVLKQLGSDGGSDGVRPVEEMAVVRGWVDETKRRAQVIFRTA